jgi:hypothetical protein
VQAAAARTRPIQTQRMTYRVCAKLPSMSTVRLLLI